jgi:hypothetical protein
MMGNYPFKKEGERLNSGLVQLPNIKKADQ